MSEPSSQMGAPTEESPTSSAESRLSRLVELARRRLRERPYYDINFTYPDGTIILKAQNTVFTVYKGPLVQYSPVFKDMLEIPQPPEAEANNPGPITVTLYDTAHDVRCLLRVLMPPTHIRLSGSIYTPFDDICACIRMAHKYQIDRIMDESLLALRRLYPDTHHLLKERSSAQSIPKPACAISVINVARLVEADSLLPMAIVECCALGSDIVNGYTRSDGTEERLSSADIGLCFQAKDRLIEARVRAFHRLFDPSVRQWCTAPDVDNPVFDRLYRALMNGAVPGLYTPKIWDSFADHLSSCVPHVCESCKEAFVSEDAAQQEAIFAQLPSLVGITVAGWGRPPRRRWIRPRFIVYSGCDGTCN